MTDQHRAVAIVPARDMGASEAFYRRLGFVVAADYGDYRILEDERGGHIHLNATPGWPAKIEDNALGLYLYVEDVDAAADRVRELIIGAGPEIKPWGTYEFAVSDPNGALVRIGRVIE
ncbi:VOC family protein [Brevundimonas nasdae]|uniref:VOC family protein n=1 Tax=Brevundimonas nasdae TaxID=172043 RepID=A0ACD4VNK6_9CAUL|nr:VOC family protein [Brevundimonas nasdae]WOB79547.1 VOC family protein [Brevundimonas nasdae]